MVGCPPFAALNGIEHTGPVPEPPEAMDEAMRLPDGLGVFVSLADPGATVRYRDRCYNARRRAMRHARKLPPADAAYCRTPWDPLVIAVDAHYVWIGKLQSTQPAQEPEAT